MEVVRIKRLLTKVMGRHAHHSVTMLRTLASTHTRPTSLLLMKQQLLRSNHFVGKAHIGMVQVTSRNQARVAYRKNPERLSPTGPRKDSM